MGITPVALYRRGNSTTARFDHVRVGTDVMSFMQNGTEWVVGRSGGVSTFSTNPPPGNGRIWALAAGASYPDPLYLNNDSGAHWSWEPSVDMPLTDYRSALAAVGRNFQ